MIDAEAKAMPIDKIAVHFHTTYGQALANILAAMEVGVSVIDSSISGLGEALMQKAHPVMLLQKMFSTCWMDWEWRLGSI